MSDSETFPCGRRCSHGGCCTLDGGHDGDHDTGFCTYSDDEALSDFDGDELFASRNPEWAALVPLQAIVESAANREPR